MRKTDLVQALHNGMEKAVVDYHDWSGGESVRDWGIESLLTVTCAQAIACQIEDAESGAMLTLEQTFQGIVAFSRAKAGRGRPSLNAARVRDKPTGRADIVLWNRGNTPRAIIEVKRQPGKDGLLKDAQRVIDFAKSCGRAAGGTVRYGAVATLLQSAKETQSGHFKVLANRRTKALEPVAARADMVLSVSTPRLIPLSPGAEGCRTASLVYVFTPRRRVA